MVTLCNATIGLFLAIIGLKHYHLKCVKHMLESVWERLVRAVEEGSKRPSKSLKGSKLRRTSNLTFSKTGLRLLTEKWWLRLSLGIIEYATSTYKKYFYTFGINQISFTYGKRKKERPNFYGMFSQKPADFCFFHRHIENEATTMQRNRSLTIGSLKYF